MPFFYTRLHLTTCTLMVALAVAGCGDDDGAPADGGAELDAAASVDAAGTDAATSPDGGRRCMTAADCDDHVSCTDDVCDPTGFCRNPINLAMCDDGLFCNGVEQCDLRRGCVPGPPESCNDMDVCTIDSCNEVDKTCEHGPRDFDEDGEADWHCPGGTDCDDRNPARASTASEICGDLVDNNCDGVVDEMTCGGPPHDTCDDPLDVSSGGAFTVSTEGAVSDYVLTCGGGGWKDIVLRLTLAEAHDVTVRVQGSTTVTAVALRNDCGGALAPTECNSGYPAEIRRRAMPAGDYFLIVSSSGPDTLDVDVTLDPPTMPPANETCTAPVDVSAGGRFTGTFVDIRSDLMTSCGFGAAPDLVYTFTTTSVRNVTISAQTPGGEQLNYSVQSTCGVETSSLRCTAGSPATGTLHELPAGTYFIVLEGPGYREVDFTLDVSFGSPTPPAVGDSCTSPIALTLGTATVGTLADKEDDLATTCGFYYRDAVYTFTLASASDVTVTVDGGGRFMNTSVRRGCTDSAGQLACVSGFPALARLRGLAAGTYFVIVEAPTGTGFTVRVDATPPTVTVPVTGNENCATAFTIPATGGLFTGNTTGFINDYDMATCGSGGSSPDAAFQLTLTASKHVVATTDGSVFDTVLFVYSGVCTSGTDIACDDDGGSVGAASLIDRTFGPGTYFFIVDGFGSSSVGAYTLEVLVSDP